MLTYRALESNGEAIACDVAAYLYGTKTRSSIACRLAAICNGRATGSLLRISASWCFPMTTTSSTTSKSGAPTCRPWLSLNPAAPTPANAPPTPAATTSELGGNPAGVTGRGLTDHHGNRHHRCGWRRDGRNDPRRRHALHRRARASPASSRRVRLPNQPAARSRTRRSWTTSAVNSAPSTST